jgi:hypothetical protein
MKFAYPTQFLIAIVFVKDQQPKKYKHMIKNNPHYISKFCRDMKRKFPGAEYVNFYYKASETFKERVYLE